MPRTEDVSELVERLARNYALEAKLYQSLLGLATEQGTILEESGDMDRCAALFERKGELLRAITDIEAEMEPVKRRWWSEAIEQESRERVNSLLDRILSKIEAITDQEQRNEELLLRRHEEVQEALGRIQRGAGMHRTQADEEPQPGY
jgi:hypothetical protein